MKTQLLAIGLVALSCGSAQAQHHHHHNSVGQSHCHSNGYGHHGYSHYHSYPYSSGGGAYVYSGPGTTPMGSYAYGCGNYLYGLGYAYAGLGQFNYYSSLAVNNLEQARGVAINNDLRAAEVKIAKREANVALQAKLAGPRVTHEQLVARSEAAAPKRLTPREYDSVLGRLTWPAALQGEDFSEDRASLNELFTQRSSMSTAQWQSKAGEARSMASAMRDRLAAKVKDVSPMEFVAAKKFLDSLSHETRLEVEPGRLAVR